jgi:ribosomal protein L37AE/L43A
MEIEILYVEVIWYASAPKKYYIASSDVDPKRDLDLSRIEVETPPRCPNCKTKIAQTPTQSFVRSGYIWKCARCGFEKRNKHSYYNEKKLVLNIAEGMFEQISEEQSEK